MVVLVHPQPDTLAPEAGDDARSLERPWPTRRLVEPGQHRDSLPLDVAPTKRGKGAWPSVEETDGTRTVVDGRASWRRASVLFTRSVRAFNAAHRRHCSLRSQATRLEVLPHGHDGAPVAAPRAGQPTLTIPEQIPGTSPLTRRQREVAVLIARGYSDKQIADELVLTTGTASNHVAHILRRLECRSRAQVAAWAVRTGLVPADVP
jgi:DNA-binding CsgD family transcriptional regulator